MGWGRNDSDSLMANAASGSITSPSSKKKKEKKKNMYALTQQPALGNNSERKSTGERKRSDCTKVVQA